MLSQFVSLFRSSAPYIHAYRGKTAVIWLNAESLSETRLPATVGDLALLNSLGLKLVVTFDIPHPFESSPLTDQTLISKDAMAQWVNQIGDWRIRLEAAFSQGLANSPMHGAQISLISGNFMTARPAGVIKGVDLGFQGRVRHIAQIAIQQQLDQGHLVLLPPLGYSISGDLYYLAPEQISPILAHSLKADKLIILGDSPQTITRGLKEFNTASLAELLKKHPVDAVGKRELTVALTASEMGVTRCHLVDANQDGALLVELFTRDGIGTLIASDPYDSFRQASSDDINGILALLKPLEDAAILVRRSREKLENEIQHFWVNERDGMVIGCGALYPISESNCGEIACVAVHPNYRHTQRGDALIKVLEKQAIALGMKKLFVLTTQTTEWFIERGYHLTQVSQLPSQRQSLYNLQRNSQVLLKSLPSLSG